MSRSVMVADGLFVATETRQVAGIAKLIQIGLPNKSGPLRILDPTAGNGTAALFLARLLAGNRYSITPPETVGVAAEVEGVVKTKPQAKLRSGQIELYGVELADTRASQLQSRFSYALNTDIKSARISEGMADIVFHNPPYDTDKDEKRLEHRLLKRATRLVRVGGLIIHIIPLSTLTLSADWLARYFTSITVWRMAEPEYSRYGQIVVMGLRKAKAYDNPSLSAKLRELAEDEKRLKVLPCPDPDQHHELLQKYGFDLNSIDIAEELKRLTYPNHQGLALESHNYANDTTAKVYYQLQPGPKASETVTFEVGEYEFGLADREARQRGIWSKPIFRQQVQAAPTSQAVMGRPLMRPRRGQVALLTLLGLFNNLVLTDKAGRAVLVKGRTYKEFKTREVKCDEDGEVIKQTDREILKSEVQVLDLQNGELEVIESSNIHSFIERFKASIQAEMSRNYPPLYSPGSPDPLIQRLERDCVKLPYRKPLGAQKLAIPAIALSLIKQGYANLAAAMGTGKTQMATVAAQLSGSRRPIITCPTHLCPKWLREILEIFPEANGMIVRRISDLEEVRRRIYQHERWQESVPADQRMPFFTIMSIETMKLGARWTPAVVYRTTSHHDYRRDDKTGQLVRNKNGSYLKWPHCPRCGSVVRNEEGGIINRAELHKKKYTCANCQERLWQCAVTYLDNLADTLLDYYAEYLARPANKRRSVTPKVEAGRWLDGFGEQALVQFREFLSSKTLEAEALRVGKSDSFWESVESLLLRALSVEATSRQSGPRRWALGSYICARMSHFFDLYIGDEIHKMKARGSAQGLGAERLANNCRRKLTLSGTFGGGYSSTLFHLMRRFGDPALKLEFGPNEELRWAWLYGVIERTTRRDGSDGEGDQNDIVEDGAMSERETHARITYREVPGISSAVLTRLLPYTVTLKLKDVCPDMPGYFVHVETFPLSTNPGFDRPNQYSCYHGLSDDLYAVIKQQLAKGSTRLLWATVGPLLRWPDNPVVGVDIYDGSLKVASAPALPADQLYPKEEALVERCLAEAAASRKTFVFITNTRKNDLSPRLKEVLTDAGLRVGVLRGVAAEKREAWIERHSPNLDVLICHPKLVETGLDLLEFPTLIFYQIEFSIYTLVQAAYRSWRVRQTKDVHVYHYAYEYTAQERALILNSRKLKAANMLDGELESDELLELAEEEGDDNLVMELARELVREAGKDEGGTAHDLESLIKVLHHKEVGGAALGNESEDEAEIETELQEDLAALARSSKHSQTAHRTATPTAIPPASSGPDAVQLTNQLGADIADLQKVAVLSRPVSRSRRGDVLAGQLTMFE